MQPNSYQRKTLAPVFEHVSDVVREKVADLLKEDLESGMSAADSVYVHSVKAA